MSAQDHLGLARRRRHRGDRQRILSLDRPAHAKAKPPASPSQKRGHVSAPGVAHSNWPRVFAAPLGLAAASSVGFTTAFLWGEIDRYLSRLGIGLPPIVMCLAASLLFSRAVPLRGDCRPGQSTGCFRHHGRRIIPTPQNVAPAIFHGSVAPRAADFA